MTGVAHSASRQSLFCCICNFSVSLETCNTDERGSPVHEQCYVNKTVLRLKMGEVVRVRENWLNSMVVRFRARSA
jgi:hypothetical protein